MNKRPSVFNVAIFFAISAVLLSFWGFSVTLVSAYRDARTAEVTAQQTQIQQTQVKTAEVLGASSCVDSKTIIDRALQKVPKSIVTAGPNVYEVSTGLLRGCVNVQFDGASDVSCGNPVVTIDYACVQKVFDTSFLFPPQKTILTGKNGQKVAVNTSDGIIDTSILAKQLSEKMNTIFANAAFSTGDKVLSESVVLQPDLITDKPGTDGTAADRYIEYDGSRQLLFVFDGGKYKTYRTSGPFDNFNQPGVYNIFNKAKLAWSRTALAWMPFWMGFDTKGTADTTLGFHALVYRYPNNQQTGAYRIYEPESHIGKQASEGCVRLTYKDAEELFNWARVGDMVIIHN